jgi:hypothetical protein
MPQHTNTEDRYRDAQIYKIYNLDCNDVYVGSTNYKHLSKRYWRHRRDGKDERYKHRYGKIFDTDNHRIEQVEAFPCRNKEELRHRERYWIEQTPHTINSTMPIVSKESTMEKNRVRQRAWYATPEGKALKKISNDRFKLKNPHYYIHKKTLKETPKGNILLKFN